MPDIDELLSYSSARQFGKLGQVSEQFVVKRRYNSYGDYFDVKTAEPGAIRPDMRLSENDGLDNVDIRYEGDWDGTHHFNYGNTSMAAGSMSYSPFIEALYRKSTSFQYQPYPIDLIARSRQDLFAKLDTQAKLDGIIGNLNLSNMLLYFPPYSIDEFPLEHTYTFGIDRVTYHTDNDNPTDSANYLTASGFASSRRADNDRRNVFWMPLTSRRVYNITRPLYYGVFRTIEGADYDPPPGTRGIAIWNGLENLLKLLGYEDNPRMLDIFPRDDSFFDVFPDPLWFETRFLMRFADRDALGNTLPIKWTHDSFFSLRGYNSDNELIVTMPMQVRAIPGDRPLIANSVNTRDREHFLQRSVYGANHIEALRSGPIVYSDGFINDIGSMNLAAISSVISYVEIESHTDPDALNFPVYYRPEDGNNDYTTIDEDGKIVTTVRRTVLTRYDNRIREGLAFTLDGRADSFRIISVTPLGRDKFMRVGLESDA